MRGKNVLVFVILTFRHYLPNDLNILILNTWFFNNYFDISIPHYRMLVLNISLSHIEIILSSPLIIQKFSDPHFTIGLITVLQILCLLFILGVTSTDELHSNTDFLSSVFFIYSKVLLAPVITVLQYINLKILLAPVITVLLYINLIC